MKISGLRLPRTVKLRRSRAQEALEGLNDVPAVPLVHGPAGAPAPRSESLSPDCKATSLDASAELDIEAFTMAPGASTRLPAFLSCSIDAPCFSMMPTARRNVRGPQRRLRPVNAQRAPSRDIQLERKLPRGPVTQRLKGHHCPGLARFLTISSTNA